MHSKLINWATATGEHAKTTSRFDLGLLVLRLSVGLLMLLAHGWSKLIGFAEKSASFPDPLGVGSAFSLGLTVFAEVFCSLAIIVGLLTRLSAVPLAITMLVAAIVIHGDDPFQKQEFALIYFVHYLILMIMGAGKYSLDYTLWGGRR